MVTYLAACVNWKTRGRKADQKNKRVVKGHRVPAARIAEWTLAPRVARPEVWRRAWLPITPFEDLERAAQGSSVRFSSLGSGDAASRLNDLGGGVNVNHGNSPRCSFSRATFCTPSVSAAVRIVILP